MSNLTVKGNASGTGTVTLESPNTNSNRTVTLPDATTTLVGTDATQTLTNKTISSSTIQGGALTVMTAKAWNWNTLSTNTFLDFDTIPSWARRITVMFNALSTNGTSDYMIQLGDSGGFETTGYTGVVQSGGASTAVFSTGFLVTGVIAAADTVSGLVTISSFGSNTWTCSISTGQTGTARGACGGGVKALSDVLTQLRITTVGGTATFDAGSVNVMYEG